MTFDEFLQEACPPLDLVWRKYRRRSARHRVDDRLRALGVADYAAYLDLLRTDPDEAGRLGDLMRVTVSRFFREWPRWQELATVVLPALLATTGGTAFRAWSAGCCAGEEPFSLALIWLELPEEVRGGRLAEVVATDIDAGGLERASAAVYAASSVREVPEDLRARWFTPEGARHWRLDNEVAGSVRFITHNLVIDPPPAVCDLAFCRYLAFTYYEGARREAAVRRLAAGVRPGGALMIGGKETLGPVGQTLFGPWPGTRGVYRRTERAAD